MKRYIILILILSASFYSCSEESLTLNSPNDVTVDALLESTAGFNQLLTGAYDAYQKIPVNEYLLSEVRSDNAEVAAEFGTLVTYNDYSITENDGEVFNYWSNNYKVIFQANIIIDNSSTLLSFADTDPTIIGEAYFLRALSHFNLVRMFRDIPYLDKVITADEVTDYPLLDEAVAYENINADFERAIELLEGVEISNTKPNVGSATIFLAKSILSQPTPDYVRVQSLLLPFLSETNEFGYRLTDNFDDIFAKGDLGDENNEEIIFKVAYTQSSASAITSDSETDIDDQVQSDSERWSYDMSIDGRSNGSNLATVDLKQFMTAEDQPVRFFTTFEEDTFLETRTYNNKWVPDNGLSSGNDWIVLRYADVLLLYGEATIGDVQSTDNADAIEAYNRVRSRAGLSSLASGETLSRDALLFERRMEFVYENQRFFDLIRFGVAVETLEAYSDLEGLAFQPNDIYLPTPLREINSSGGFFN